MAEPRALLVHPGDLSLPTGGYGYDRRMLAELRTLGWSIDALRLEGGFPRPEQPQRQRAYEILAAQADDVLLLVDGLALGALPEVGSRLRERQTLVALVHHPLALETGLDPGVVEQARVEERLALARADKVVCTSGHTARALAQGYGVSFDRITVAQPGTDRVTLSPASPTCSQPAPCKLLAVGSLVPRKGHDLLISALARLSSLSWQLCIAGDDGLAPETARTLRGQLHTSGLGDRVRMPGAVSAQQLESLYREADIFVLASRHEGFGMAYAEAIAWGLPVIGTTAGAISEAVPEGAGLLVPPEDVDALTEALRLLLSDPDRRHALATMARSAASRQPGWPDSARLLSRAMLEAKALRQPGVLSPELSRAGSAKASTEAAADAPSHASADAPSDACADAPLRESFSSSWLALREPADLRARDPALLEAVLAYLRSLKRPRITDLGCGSGASLRVLAPRLGPSQCWHLVDHDPALLAAALDQARRLMAGASDTDALNIQTMQADLHEALDGILALPADLIITSAFLDLVSQEWAMRFVEALARRGLPFYAALSYDGRVLLSPSDPLDSPALDAFNRHQLGDKGLGAALGPRAAGVMIGLLETAGYGVRWAQADWQLDASQKQLQHELLEGWCKAIGELGHMSEADLRTWSDRRRALIDQDRSRMQIGHIDLWAWPSRGRG